VRLITPVQRSLAATLVFCCAVLVPASSGAQPPASNGETQAVPPAPAPQSTDEAEDDDAILDPAEPDVVIVNLPTSLRFPRYGSNFRMTHRFAGNLRQGSFTDNLGNLFGLDQGAIIGLEFRMSVVRNLQAAIFRTNFDKTIQMYAKYDAARQGDAMPVSLSALVSIEGTDNFRTKYAPAVGGVISWKAGTRLAAYAVPMWVGHTNASLEPIHHDHGGGEAEVPAPEHERLGTFFVGLGGRARLTRTVYVVGEITPRVSGYAPDEVEYGFGVEKRVGGHAFAVTFTNTFGTTFAQLARGGTANTLYLGFNLGRKFF
jgi:hypothetical protein